METGSLRRLAVKSHCLKKCTKCGFEKSLSDFYSDKRAFDGRYSHCKTCHRSLTKSWEQSRPDLVRAATARYRERNPGAGKEKNKEWRAANKKRLAVNQARYAKRNPEKIRELGHRSTAKRKACKVNATPAWADLKEIARIYREARSLTKSSSTLHHVDHIVPLISPLVCGLHVPANLRVVTEAENTAKSNRYWPDMP